MKIKCRSCGREFEITNPKQKFCSEKCIRKSYYNAHKDERKKHQREYSAKQRAEKRKAGVKR